MYFALFLPFNCPVSSILMDTRQSKEGQVLSNLEISMFNPTGFTKYFQTEQNKLIS